MTYQRETKEFQPISIKVDGVEVLEGVEVSVIPSGTRPTEWSAPFTLDGKLGVMIEGFVPDTYQVWAKITSVPEIPVIYCGNFKVI